MSQLVQAPPDLREISQKGQEILEALSEQLKAEHDGECIAIASDSGEYFLGDMALEATRKAQANHPGKIFFLGRIGYRTASTLKGRR